MREKMPRTRRDQGLLSAMQSCTPGFHRRDSCFQHPLLLHAEGQSNPLVGYRGKSPRRYMNMGQDSRCGGKPKRKRSSRSEAGHSCLCTKINMGVANKLVVGCWVTLPYRMSCSLFAMGDDNCSRVRLAPKPNNCNCLIIISSGPLHKRYHFPNTENLPKLSMHVHRHFAQHFPSASNVGTRFDSTFLELPSENS